MDTVIAGQNAGVSGITSITVSRPARQLGAKHRCQTIHLPESREETTLAIGNISKDISFTHSRCLFKQDYHARISHKEQTTLLVFGLEG